MIVMMMAMTPSLKASAGLYPYSSSNRRRLAVAHLTAALQKV
jgi:hypothetical protein